jgi:hypothetical protein
MSLHRQLNKCKKYNNFHKIRYKKDGRILATLRKKGRYLQMEHNTLRIDVTNKIVK